MQYILTEEEYKKLIENQRGIHFKEIIEEEVQDRCTYIACNLPVKLYGTIDKHIWGCILDEESGTKVCDQCPMDLFCPYEFKEYSQ